MDAGPGLMQLEAAKILRCRRIRRTAEESCESLDLSDIVVARLLDEVAHRHVFDHTLAQRADGFLAHRGALGEVVEPPDPQGGTPVLSPYLNWTSAVATNSASRAARSRVSGFVLWPDADIPQRQLLGRLFGAKRTRYAKRRETGKE